MFAHLGPAPPVQGTDLIARAVGARALAALGGHSAGRAGAPGAAGGPGKQATAEGGPWR